MRFSAMSRSTKRDRRGVGRLRFCRVGRGRRGRVVRTWLLLVIVVGTGRVGGVGKSAGVCSRPHSSAARRSSAGSTTRASLGHASGGGNRFERVTLLAKALAGHGESSASFLAHNDDQAISTDAFLEACIGTFGDEEALATELADEMGHQRSAGASGP